MGILIHAGETSSLLRIKAVLEGREIDFHHPDNMTEMQRVTGIVSLLSPEQRQDFLGLWQDGYVTPPRGFQVGLKGDVGNYLVTLTREQFLEYYRTISQLRESNKGVKRIIETEN